MDARTGLWKVTQEALRASNLGKRVRRLSRCANVSVARASERIIGKWKAQLMGSEQPPEEAPERPHGPVHKRRRIVESDSDDDPPLVANDAPPAPAPQKQARSAPSPVSAAQIEAKAKQLLAECAREHPAYGSLIQRIVLETSVRMTSSAAK